MKKSLLALGAACIALNGLAASPVQMKNTSLRNQERSAQLKSDIANMRAGSVSRAMKAPAKAMSSADVITSPEGKVQDMTTTGTGYFAFFGYLFSYANQESANHVVYGDNDEVYFYDILPNASADSYVKGVRKGDKIEISLPQVVLYMDDAGYGYQLSLLNYTEYEDEDGEVKWWYEASDADSVTLSVAEDGSMVMDGLSEELMLGLTWTDDNSWSGNGAIDLSMVPFNEVAVTPPSDVEVSEGFWLNGLGGYAESVNWAQCYDEVYFQGLSSSMPEAWIKGTVEYGDDSAIISIAQDQYIGVYAAQHVYTKCATIEYDAEGEVVDGELMPEDYKYELIWNYEDNTIVAKDPEVSLVFNAAKDRIYYVQILTDIKLVHQDDFAGVPANPYGLSFEDTYLNYEYGTFKFNVPAVSTDGDFLDTDSLSYVVYVDGDEWEFDAEEYDLTENMVEIPWNFGAYYIYKFSGTLREVDFFVEGITTLGVQSVYNYNGEETRSEVVEINLDDPVAVAAIDGGKKVADVKYYDLSGREVASPAAGIFVKRVTFDDGSVASFKKAVR